MAAAMTKDILEASNTMARGVENMNRKKVFPTLIIALIFMLINVGCVSAKEAPHKMNVFIVSGRSIYDSSAAKMEELFRETKLAGYSLNHMVTICYDADNDPWLSKDAFFNYMDSAFKDSRSGDLNIFFYTGHGSTSSLILEKGLL